MTMSPEWAEFEQQNYDPTFLPKKPIPAPLMPLLPVAPLPPPVGQPVMSPAWTEYEQANFDPYTGEDPGQFFDFFEDGSYALKPPPSVIPYSVPTSDLVQYIGPDSAAAQFPEEFRGVMAGPELQQAMLSDYYAQQEVDPRLAYIAEVDPLMKGIGDKVTNESGLSGYVDGQYDPNIDTIGVAPHRQGELGTMMHENMHALAKEDFDWREGRALMDLLTQSPPQSSQHPMLPAADQLTGYGDHFREAPEQYWDFLRMVDDFITKAELRERMERIRQNSLRRAAPRLF